MKTLAAVLFLPSQIAALIALAGSRNDGDVRFGLCLQTIATACVITFFLTA